MRKIDLRGKCGSCWYFHEIKGSAHGECYKFPYGDDVVHGDHPYFEPTRSRQKCREYKKRPKTRADLMRSSTDEEIADELIDWFVAFYDIEWSRDTVLEFLREEA